MHDTAYRIGGLVMGTYLPSNPARILEIGAQNVNGTLRDHAPRNAEYIGLDFESGDGVDIVVSGLADWNVPDASFDLVMASSVFEHDKAFWRTFLAMCAKTKPGGHIYISAPFNGTVHRYPQDYWRFYPDSGLALEEWAREEGFEVTLIESFIAERETEVWNDFCAVFRRGPDNLDLNRDFVFEKVASTNALTWRSKAVINPVEDSEDTRLLRAARDDAQRWVQHSEYLTALHAEELQLRTRQIADLTQEIEQQAHRLTAIGKSAHAKDEELAVLRSRAEALTDEIARLNAEAKEQAEQREQQILELTNASSELQSRLAQRDEEAEQAWACVDKREKERDELAVETEKARADLADANGWVAKLALTRTQMERRIARLESDRVKLSRDLDRKRQRNEALVARVDELSKQAVAAPEILKPVIEQEARRGRVPDEPASLEVDALEAEHEALKAELETSRSHLARTETEFAETKHQLGISMYSAGVAMDATSSGEMALDECRGEIALLSDMVAEEQDRVIELERKNAWLREAGSLLLERGKWWWRFMPRSWQRRKRDARLLRRNLFDAEAYANRYPDVVASGQDPLRHFIHHGIAENRHYD